MRSNRACRSSNDDDSVCQFVIERLRLRQHRAFPSSLCSQTVRLRPPVSLFFQAWAGEDELEQRWKLFVSENAARRGEEQVREGG